jgi:hypothetical protein
VIYPDGRYPKCNDLLSEMLLSLRLMCLIFYEHCLHSGNTVLLVGSIHCAITCHYSKAFRKAERATYNCPEHFAWRLDVQYVLNFKLIFLTICTFVCTFSESLEEAIRKSILAEDISKYRRR